MASPGNLDLSQLGRWALRRNVPKAIFTKGRKQKHQGRWGLFLQVTKYHFCHITLVKAVIRWWKNKLCSSLGARSLWEMRDIFAAIFRKYNLPQLINLRLWVNLSKAQLSKDQLTKWLVFYFTTFTNLSKTYLFKWFLKFIVILKGPLSVRILETIRLLPGPQS